MEKAAESMFASQDNNSGKTEESITLEEAVEAINTKTLDSAKIIAKYQMKNTKELKEAIKLILDGLPGGTSNK